MASNKKKAKKKSSEINFSPFLIIVGIIGSLLTVYIAYRASTSDRNLFSIGLITLFAGLIFESIRISGNWKTVIGIFVVTYLFSLLGFLPGRSEQNYNFENHIQMWPYFFISIFAVFFGIAYKDKVITKLNEGVTLLLSISLIYWTVDYGFINYHNWFSISLLTIGALLCIFSIINALSYIHLTRTTRLTLSIWSSIIMFAFALDNVIRVFSNPDIESSKYLSDGLFIGIQYFLLGISTMYIVQNFMLLADFLPSKNGNYKRDLEENKKDHINRYSDRQVNISHSFFYILFTGSIYWLNHKYQILPRHTMIWLVFFTFPIIIQLTSLITRTINTKDDFS